MCSKNNVQFLDDTVHLSGIRIGKNDYGQTKLLRVVKCIVIVVD